MIDKIEKYRVRDSSYHGGEILKETTSPREAYRARKKHADGCLNGKGCQRIEALMNGEWHRTHIEKSDHTGSDRVAEYSDANYRVEIV